MTDPLLRKSWMETRLRFGVGLVVLLIMSAGIVYGYPELRRLLLLPERFEVDGAIGRFVTESINVQRDFRGYVWFQWFRQNLSQFVTLFAVLLGSGSLVSHGPSGSSLFVLSLPVSRPRLVVSRSIVGMAEIAALAFVPSLAIPGLAPLIGERYAVADALAHGLCVFVVAGMFFSMAVALSAAFNDLWRPLLIVLTVAIVLGVSELIPANPLAGVFRTMSAAGYFRSGTLPWIGLLGTLLVSATLLYSARVILVRRDF